MDFPTIQSILEDWTILAKEIREFSNFRSMKRNNTRRAMFLFRELADYLREHVPILNAWMNDYLSKNKKLVFVTWWGNHVGNWAQDQIQRWQRLELHPRAKEDWDSFFGDHSTMKFSVVERFMKDLNKKRTIEACDDASILAIHEGRPHDGDGWSCYDCDEQENAWNRELIRRVTHSHHPLLNPEQRKTLLLRWKDTQIESWLPPLPKISTYEINAEIPTSYVKEGQTRIQALEPFLEKAVGPVRPLAGIWRIRNKSEYDIFYFLWTSLPNVLPMMEWYEAELKKIESLF
jgi:hypothetical protein